MKTLLLFSAFVLYAVLALPSKITITNSGFTFTPDSIGISVNDTVVFQIASIHTALEVSEATWNANGNTPLPGGFSLGFGGGQVTGLTAGVHYYVCSPHVSLGMKGRIFVTSGLGINITETRNGKISITPNPTKGKFSLYYQESDMHGDATQEIKLDIYNFLGEKIFSQTNLQPQMSYELDLTSFPEGVYFLSIINDRKTNTVRIVKR
jgi:plastocyanin